MRELIEKLTLNEESDVKYLAKAAKELEGALDLFDGRILQMKNDGAEFTPKMKSVIKDVSNLMGTMEYIKHNSKKYVK